MRLSLLSDRPIGGLKRILDLPGRKRPFLPLRHVLEIEHRPGTFEDPGKRIVIRLWNRIELMVMTACAADRHAEERLAERIDLLVDDVLFLLDRIVLRQHLRTKRQIPGSD